MSTFRKVRIHSVRFLALAIIMALFTGVRGNAAGAAMDFIDGIRLPIIMYHSIINDSCRWGTYVISPVELENDLKYIQANGYTTVTVQDLLDYVHEGKMLPEKPIMLTFDDGYYNNYLYAFPLLKKYNMKAVISIIGTYTDKYSLTVYNNQFFSHVTWNQVKEMVDSGTIEIQNHSYNLHKINSSRTASMRAKGETIEHYETVFISDTIRLQSLIDNITGHMPTTYTYPYGLVSKESTEILKEIGFRSSLICCVGTNTITNDPNCLYLLKRNLRPHGKSVARILEKVS